MSQTQLSTLIEDLQASWSTEKLEMLLHTFRQTTVGINAFNVPKEYLGMTVQTESEGITLGSTTHGDGKSRVMAYADPRQFIAKFGQKFNGEMLGEEVIRVALHNPSCVGILLNSAFSEISVAIDREDFMVNIHTKRPIAESKIKHLLLRKFFK